MKIGVDISDLATDRADGTTRYTRELALRLPQLGSKHQWHFYTPAHSASVKAVATGSNVHLHVSPWPRYWTQARFPFDLYRYRPDVLLMPIQQLPYLRPGRVKTVAVIHDLAFHQYPKQTAYKDWLLLHVFTPNAVREADALIAVSHTTASDITRYYGRTEQVHVVHHGVDHTQFRVPQSDADRIAGWEVLTNKYPKLKQPYLLYVGQIQPRKNIKRLIAAFEQVSAKHPDLQLVIAGSHGWRNKGIHTRITGSSKANRIVTTGRVPDTLLPALYWHASAFVLPSLYEGFGLPVLEALACGTPVVTSNVSSLPEVAGDAAILVDPHATKSIAAGIEEALQRKDELSKIGRARASEFTWEKTAVKTLRVLESLENN